MNFKNDPNVSRHLYMDNQYYDPQLFELMERSYNMRGVGTCRSNRKGFYYEHLLMNKHVIEEYSKFLVDKSIGMDITR